MGEARCLQTAAARKRTPLGSDLPKASDRLVGVHANWPKEPQLVVFFIPLPDSLALPDQATFVFRRRGRLLWPKLYWPKTNKKLSGKNYVILRVHRVPEQLEPNVKPFEQAVYVASKVTHLESEKAELPDQRPYASQATVIEAASPLAPVRRADGKLDMSRSLDEAFDAIMDSLGDLTRSYLAASRISSLSVPTRHSLFGFLPFTTRSPIETPEEHRGEKDARRAAWGDLQFYRPTHMVDRYIPRDVHELSASDFERMLVHLSRAEENDPFATYTERARACQRAIYTEPDYVTAAIEAQLASEFLFDALLLVMAWEEGVKPDDAARWFAEPLSRRIRKHYRPRLGGSWETKNARTVIGRWARYTRDLRNRVAHAGYRPSELDAVRSWDAFGALEGYLKNRLASKRNAYPRTTLLLIGTPGLQRRGLYSGAIVRFVNTVASTEPYWLMSFSTWATEFERARTRSFS